MPGRSGYGVGHNPGRAYVPDPELVQLTEWIGEDDAGVYAEMFQVICAG